MKTTITIHTNDSIEAMGERFADAWHRAESGEHVGERHIGFADFDKMMSTLTPKRLALLRTLHKQPVKDVMALSRMLDRDYKRVYEDVRELSSIGLVEKSAKGVRVLYDVIRAELTL